MHWDFEKQQMVNDVSTVSSPRPAPPSPSRRDYQYQPFPAWTYPHGSFVAVIPRVNAFGEITYAQFMPDFPGRSYNLFETSRMIYCYPFRTFADASGYVSGGRAAGNGGLWAVVVNNQAELDAVSTVRVPPLASSLVNYPLLNTQIDSPLGLGPWIPFPIGSP